MTDQGFGTVRPLPGNGLVAYESGLLLVCDVDEDSGTRLIDALRQTAASGGDGRALARRAAQVLAATMTSDPGTCAVAGRVGDGVAVLVSGAASAHVTGPAGETRLSGSDSLTWADRLIGGPVERVELVLPGAGRPHPAVRFESGVVHGGGIVGELTAQSPAPSRPLTSEMPNTALHFEPDLMPRQEPPAPAQAPPYPMSGTDQPPPLPPQPPSGPQPQPHSQPQMGPPVIDQPPARPEPAPFPSYDEPAPAAPSSGNGTMPEYEQQPAPMGPPPQDHYDPGPPLMGPPQDLQPPMGPPHDLHPPMGPPSQEQQAAPVQEQDHGDRPLVYGVDCKNDHFNDPRAPYCAVCGIALVQRALVPYKGPRPALGVLVLDDGTALPLETDYLLGRDPERAPEVAGGSARPAKVTSPDGSVSRRHLRVALDGWDVNLVDLGSVNGTQIQPPGDPNFYDIPPNEPVTIAPGTTVRVGVSRTLRFEPHRG
ncbi:MULTISPECIES: FHA domain-containing protein [Nonomuraea]|uniref:FHA domain-containing protein n=2 Tax=Nonomuraea TaxID=83681 RepID=A0ABW1BYQ3_9ACTN|nr:MULTISPECIES: FHA domain-containing protein [Nonomuraea]MDA0645035.1 FHA domain-containing protein [Nonomuraea ferruginea]TXK40603.1 FHA domain-containing protein [Nonomuraea sp. C10]